jgi:WW domain
VDKVTDDEGPRKRKATPSTDSALEVDDDLRKQGLKAQNALLAHHDALESLPELEKEAERQESSSTADPVCAPLQEPSTRSDIICTTTTAFAELQQSLAIYTDPTQRQKLVLQRSVHVLQQLLQQWTIVDLSTPTSTAERQQTEAADRQQPASTPKESEGSKKTTTSVPSYLRPAGSFQSEQESTTGPRNPETTRKPVLGHPRSSVPSVSVEDWEDTLQDGGETSQAGKNGLKPTNQANSEQEHQAAMRRRIESEQHEIEILRRKHELQMAMETRQEELNAARREAERRQLEAHREKLSNIETKRKSGGSPTGHAAPAPPTVVEKAEANRNDAKTFSDMSLPDRALHTKGNDPISPIPSGWTSHWDAKAGRFYYYDWATRKTQWEDPYTFREPGQSAYPQFERSEKTPILERKGTRYAMTAGERTIVGEGSRPSVLPSPAIEPARSTKPPANDLFAQFFSGLADGGGSNSNTLRSPAPCRACDGRGGREDKTEKCLGCGGRGEVTVTRRSSGGHRRSVRRECRGCNGTGYQCKVCLGTKKELVPGGSGAHFVYGKGGEDEPGSERMQCASQ